MKQLKDIISLFKKSNIFKTDVLWTCFRKVQNVYFGIILCCKYKINAFKCHIFLYLFRYTHKTMKTPKYQENIFDILREENCGERIYVCVCVCGSTLYSALLWVSELVQIKSSLHQSINNIYSIQYTWGISISC